MTDAGVNLPRNRYTHVMASITNKINDLLHSPKTKEMVDKAKAAATKPENRAKIKQMQDKFTNRTRGQGQHEAPGGSPPAGDGADIRPGAGPTGASTAGYGEDSSGSVDHGERTAGISEPGGYGERTSGAGGRDADQSYGRRSASEYEADVTPESGSVDRGDRSGY